MFECDIKNRYFDISYNNKFFEFDFYANLKTLSDILIVFFIGVLWFTLTLKFDGLKVTNNYNYLKAKNRLYQFVRHWSKDTFGFYLHTLFFTIDIDYMKYDHHEFWLETSFLWFSICLEINTKEINHEV